MMVSQTGQQASIRDSTWLDHLNGACHTRALTAYMLIVFGHWAEHIAQAYQVFVLEWHRPDAGGILGLWFPALASSEILHFAYNLGLLVGLIVLLPGFRGHARTWWMVALIIQGWHFFEHLLLQIQWLTGWYLFGAEQQISLLQPLIPRVELHFLYNTVVFIPMVVAMFLYSRHRCDAQKSVASE